MKRIFFLSATIGCTIFAGCEAKTTPTSGSTKPAVPMSEKPAATNDGMKPAAGGEFKAESEMVKVAPGGEVRVKMMNAAGTPLDTTIDPTDAKVNVTAEKDAIVVKAADDAKGTVTVTVKEATKSAMFKVMVEGKK